jgi:hypothetical protein
MQKQQAFSRSSNLVVCEFCASWAISHQDGALILYCICDCVSDACGLRKGLQLKIEIAKGRIARKSTALQECIQFLKRMQKAHKKI